jgi:hypothetical protein
MALGRGTGEDRTGKGGEACGEGGGAAYIPRGGTYECFRGWAAFSAKIPLAAERTTELAVFNTKIPFKCHFHHFTPTSHSF